MWHNHISQSYCISQAGHKNEIAASTTTATDLSVFRGVLESEVLRILQLGIHACDDDLPTFKRMCSQSQMAYTYTQTVLHFGIQLTEGTNNTF